MSAKKESAVKRMYLRQIKRGKAPQEAQVDAARKLACIIWKIMTSKQRYVEEDKYLTATKVRQTSYNAKRVIKDAVMPEDVPELAKSLSSDIEVLEQYSTGLDLILRRNNKLRKKSLDRSDLKR